MAYAKINQASLVSKIQNMVNGLVARIIDEESQAAQKRLQERIAAETRSFTVEIIKASNNYELNPEVNVVIRLPEADVQA